MIHNFQPYSGNRSFLVENDKDLNQFGNTNSIRRTQSNVALRPQNLNLDRFPSNVINPDNIDLNPNSVKLDHIQIEVPRDDKRGESNVLQNNNVAKVFDPVVSRGATEPSFAQRHPTLTKLFAGFVAVLAFPVILAVSLVVTPFLMGAALFSKTCGSGELAKDIGSTTLAKMLWGSVADDMTNGSSHSGLMALSVLPISAPLVYSGLGAAYVYKQICDKLFQSPLPTVSNANFPKSEPQKNQGGRAELETDHVKPEKLRDKPVSAFHDAKGEQIGYVDEEGHVYDRDGKPFNGVAPELDGNGMAAYGVIGNDENNKPIAKRLDIIPSPDKLWIKQGRTGDCDILTIMNGLLKQPAINRQFADNCLFKVDGSLVMKLPKTELIEKNLQSRWYQMAPKGYAISASDDAIFVQVSKEKLNQILQVKQMVDGDPSGENVFLGKRAMSNSLFVIVMEHLIGNMNMYPDPEDIPKQGGLNESFEANWSFKHGYRSTPQIEAAALLGCNVKHYGGCEQNQIIKWESEKKCLTDSQASSAPGIIICKGVEPHLGHFYALHDTVKNNEGEIVSVRMVNPWDTKSLETWSVDKFKAAQIFEVGQSL